MLLVHLVAPIFPGTRCSRIPVMQEESVAQCHDTWTVNEPQTADPHLAAGLEGRYVGNRSKKHQWDTVEKTGSQKSVSCNKETVMHGHNRHNTTMLSIIHNMSTTCFGQYYFWPSSGWIQLSEKTTQCIIWYSITISVGVSRWGRDPFYKIGRNM